MGPIYFGTANSVPARDMGQTIVSVSYAGRGNQGLTCFAVAHRWAACSTFICPVNFLRYSLFLFLFKRLGQYESTQINFVLSLLDRQVLKYEDDRLDIREIILAL